MQRTSVTRVLPAICLLWAVGVSPLRAEPIVITSGLFVVPGLYDRDLMIKRKYLSALLGGTTAVGHIPEFLHLLTQFSSKEIATQVLRDAMPVLSQLAQRVPNPTLFWRIVAGSVDRHLL